jgi:hypothetical protein
VLNIFELVAQKLGQGDKLELVYVPMDFLLPILNKYKNISIVPFFKKSVDAINYVNRKATALLIYYGLTLDENPLANDSFPSRFVEFCHAGIPIICIAPEQTEFHNFLSVKNYPLLFSSTNINTLKTKLEQLKNKDFWESCAKTTHSLAINYFNAEELQACFEKALTPGNNRHEH